MTFDVNRLQDSVRRRKGLMDKLGDAGRFLGELVRARDFSKASIQAKIGELETYLATSFDQIEEMGEQWQKTDHQLAQLRGKLKDASRATKSTLLAQAEVLLRRTDGYQAAIDKVKINGLSAQVLVEKLRDLLILTSGPMPEDAIDQWTAQLEDGIAERGMTDRALGELGRVSQRWVAPPLAVPAAEKTTEQTETRLESLAPEGPPAEAPSEVERRLAELFEE